MSFKGALHLAIYVSGFLAGNFPLVASESVIDGRAPHLSGKVIRLVSDSDPISGELIVHDLDTISSSGAFSLQLNVYSTGAYRIAVNRFSAPIYIAPGERYTIQIAIGERDILIDTWQKGAIDYVFVDLDSTDVNAGISRFEQAYYAFFTENESLIGSRAMQPAIAAFEAKQLELAEGKGEFLNTYVKYALGSMKLALGGIKTTLYGQYIDGQAVELQNPSWFAFIDQFYGQYFDAYDSEFGGETIYNRLNKGLGLTGLDSLIQEDTLLANSEIKRVVMLKSISESLYNAKYPSDALLQIAGEISDIQDHPWDLIAARIVAQYEARNLAFKAEDLSLDFQDGDIAPWLVADTMLTYVFATASWSLEGAKELDLLQNLASKYPDLIKILTVYIDGLPDIALNTWLVSAPEDSFLYMQAMEAYAVPHCFWVAPGGDIRRDKVCIKPSEGLEKTLFKLKTVRDKKLKIKVGQ